MKSKKINHYKRMHNDKIVKFYFIKIKINKPSIKNKIIRYFRK